MTMSYPERLYHLYKENPNISNQEAVQKLGWTDKQVRKYKYLLKKRGIIGVDENEIIILKDYGGNDLEATDFKQDAYRKLYDVCIEKAEHDESFSVPQFIQIVQEIRLILNKIV